MSMIAGMCQSCYEAWRYAGKPDLDEWVPKRRRKLRQVQAVHQTRGEKGNGHQATTKAGDRPAPKAGPETHGAAGAEKTYEGGRAVEGRVSKRFRQLCGSYL